MPTKYLTVVDVAERFQVHRNTVYTWVREGRLEVTRWSKRSWRFSEAAVDAFAQANSIPAERPERVA